MAKNELKYLGTGPRAVILEAALQVISTQPFNRFSIAEIARAADSSKPQVSYHFKTADDVLEALIQAWGTSGRIFTDEFLADGLGLSPEELIHAIVDATFSWSESYPRFSKMSSLIMHLASVEPRLSRLQKQALVHGQERIFRILKNSKIEGARRASLAKAIHLTLMGGFLYHLANPDEEARPIVKAIKASIASLLQK